MSWISDVYGRRTVAPLDWWEVLPRKVYSELERVQCSQPWFEVYRIKRDVYAFYEPGQFEEVLSYLVVGKKNAALIDTGCGIGNIKKLAEESTKLPIKVVNTHSHYDHVAQNNLFTDTAIFDAPNARQTSKTGYSIPEMSSLLGEGMLSKPLPKDFDAENYHVPPFTVTRWLKNGDTIDLGDRRLEVIHTPGHSVDSICLLDRTARILWTGDTFYPGPIYLHLPGSDLDAFINSYAKMIALSPHFEKLAPSHNEPLVEKNILEQVMEAAQSIREGESDYTEDTNEGTKVRRYKFGRFSIITAAS
jgi:glyoxylase-like metal-dependent hydrolase (beta-lactamase superfamily II)